MKIPKQSETESSSSQKGASVKPVVTIIDADV